MKRRMAPNWLFAAASLASALIGCGKSAPDYGVEQSLRLPGNLRQVWAVAPVINDSGQKNVDPILQADLIYQQLQQVEGLTVIPVNRVVEIYTSLRLEKVQSAEQAAIVCELLGADALLIGTVTIYDPYDPPKMAASLTLIPRGGYQRPINVDIRELVRRATPATMSASTAGAGFAQVVGMFDAANGSVRAEVTRYAQGRSDPSGPYQARLYLIEMDRYGGFVYNRLIGQLLGKPQIARFAPGH